MNIKTILNQLTEKHDLDSQSMTDIMLAVIQGQLSDPEIAALLVALKMKGESITELSAAACVMRRFATGIIIDPETTIDIVGTGGDNANLFNISTVSSFIAGAAGAKVAKHGNHSVSSKSGSADVLVAAGTKINLPISSVQHCYDTVGISFLFAPQHHSALQHIQHVRKQLGIRTLFNLLGPLTNPAGVKRQLIGVNDKKWCRPFAEVTQNLGLKHVMVVHSDDGLDEISVAAPTYVTELKNDVISEYIVTPQQLGVKPQTLTGLQVTDADESLNIIMSVFENKATNARDIACLNAGSAIYIAGLAETQKAGVQKAFTVLENGKALQLFRDFISLTNSFEV